MQVLGIIPMPVLKVHVSAAGTPCLRVWCGTNTVWFAGWLVKPPGWLHFTLYNLIS